MSHDSPTDSVVTAADGLADSAAPPQVNPTDGVPQIDAPPKSRWRSLIQFRLWMLLLLFIPAAYFAKGFVPEYRVSYYEEKADFWQTGMQELDFTTLPNGTATNRDVSIDAAYQSKGVSFVFGVPDRKPGTDFDVGEVDAIFVGKMNEQSTPNNGVYRPLPAGSPLKELDPEPTFNKSKNAISDEPITIGKVRGPGFIAISGYPFRSSFAKYPSTISCFGVRGKYQTRFKGPMTIRFHQPGDPKGQAGVYRVGFYAGRLNHAEALRVSLYGLDGNLICRQSNIQHRPFAFMGFSCTRKISRIEIETIGMDQDYAISGLMFDEVDLGLSGMAE